MEGPLSKIAHRPGPLTNMAAIGAVSEEKILRNRPTRKRIAYGGHVC
jgi:hypothetical protein